MGDASRTTIAEIAKIARVSVPTVSKVLNGRTGVSEETRKRVNGLLEQHNYRRRGTARRNRVGLIDFVVRNLDTVWSMPLVAGAEREAVRHGFNLVVTSMERRTVGTQQWIRQLATRRTDAVVLVVSEVRPWALNELLKLNVPVVLLDPVGIASVALPAVSATNWAGGVTATEHLIGLGHRRIGIITGPEELMCARERRDGYRSALAHAGIAHDPELEVVGDFLPGTGYDLTKQLLALPDPPTAIFACADRAAAGVYKAAHELGRCIPQDLSVVGFDDVVVAEWLEPPLTTVRQPLEHMAREAIRAAVELINGAEPEHSRRELATSLVVRASTVPLPSGTRGSEPPH
ncbi:LacI family DNA-binding transcriptional regulator [Demequina sp.]|uniref:LacI family DNA-binding transcriptional regulator n=1 Tax=Demequina sp. TaxID=2050685 RepID=UPI003D1202E0